MSGAQSISARRAYGVHRVCRVWGRARSSVYARRHATRSRAPRRRGPVGAATDVVLVGHIRRVLDASPFHGEGYRKVWAKLRVAGIRTSKERVRRLMREHGLQAPYRAGHAHGPKAHDGTITTETPDVMWGTDMTATVTVGEGAACVFVAVDHCTTECIGLHAAKSGSRFEALEPIRQGIRERFGGIGEGVARGLGLRHDHGSHDLADNFQHEIAFFGIESSPSFVREPEGNGVAERFIRTLKENVLWVRSFETIEELRLALLAFKQTYNEQWMLEKYDYRSPAQVRRDLVGLESARRLADPIFTQGLWIDRYYLLEFVDRREQFLQEVLQGLDPHSKAALALIYMRNDRLESPIALQESEREALERLGSNLGNCVTALDALNGSLVQGIDAEGDYVWRFKHPTIGDAYASLLTQHPELLGIYVGGAATDELIGQVTCGDVGLERAVVIPRALFPLMLQRLQEFSTTAHYKTAWMSKWGARRDLQRFLAFRCSKDFLVLYIEQDPEMFDRVAKPGLMLSAVSEVDLALRLHELGLLPEETRQKFIEAVSKYVIDGEDFSALQSDRLRHVFSEDEFDELQHRVRAELLPRLDDVCHEWQSNHQSDESAEDHMQPLLEAFETLKAMFDDDETAVEKIDRETEHVQEWLGEHTPDDSDERPERRLGEAPASDILSGDRSIFDDVDA